MGEPEFSGRTSVRGREWKMRSVPEGFVAPPQVHPSAVRVAAARGFDLDGFFNPKIKTEMPDPYALKGMREAVGAFCRAVKDGRNIALYGDYDVDGATSTALVARWLKAATGNAVNFYIPDRMKEGYGLNDGAIRSLHADGTEFLLVLDSGTTAHGPLGLAVELGLEVVMLDHHEPDDRDPPGVLVNPKRRDEDRRYDYLCTAGLAFLFLVGVNRELRSCGWFGEGRKEPDLKQWLGIVALGTVADMVPLVGLNRAYVTTGLKAMHAVPGLAALNEANGDCGFNANTCGFVFGPCINASGRIGNTRTGVHLLADDDMDSVRGIAQVLVETNKERQDIQKAALDRAMEEAKASNDPVVVLHDPEWHPGVVGLVASRIKDALDRSAVVVGMGGAGSCRAVDGFDIGAAVIAAKEAGILIKGGGHTAAAGLTVDPERIGELAAFMAERAKGFVPPPVEIDLAFECGRLDPAAVHVLEALEPYGMKNPKPRIVVHGGWARQVNVMKERHVKVILCGPAGETEAIMWNAIGTPLGDALAESEDRWVDVYGTAKVDEYGGRRRATLMVEDAILGASLASAAA